MWFVVLQYVASRCIQYELLAGTVPVIWLWQGPHASHGRTTAQGAWERG